MRVSSKRERQAISEAFGRRLDAILTRRNISNSELARRIGCSDGYVWQLRHGRSAPTIVTLYYVKKAIGNISWKELLGGP